MSVSDMPYRRLVLAVLALAVIAVVFAMAGYFGHGPGTATHADGAVEYIIMVG